MSTIVVVRKGNVACMMADSLTSFGDQTLHASLDKHSNKIQEVAGSHWGIVGSAAHSLVIESAFGDDGIEGDFSSRASIFQTMLQLHKKMKDDYYLNPSDQEEDPYESIRFDAVLMNPHGIFGLFSLREVYEYTQYWAVGAGADYALGAMHAVYNRYKSAESIAKAGIEASATFNNSTALPATSQTVTLLDPV